MKISNCFETDSSLITVGQQIANAFAKNFISINKKCCGNKKNFEFIKLTKNSGVLDFLYLEKL
jgi:hypothetical protein